MRDQSALRRRGALIDTTIGFLEDALYAVITVILTACGVALVVVVARDLPDTFTGGSQDAVLGVLDVVLLVFIVVELLSAVRQTVIQRELIAEPFLLVGIIASIKEIVVMSVKAAEAVGKGDKFIHSVTLIGVLGVLVLLLALAALMLRRKEREPDEGDEDDDDQV